ncbi:peptide chain release factor 2 [bacterium]|nr:peptide chain release factor 2 [bacterium]
MEIISKSNLESLQAEIEQTVETLDLKNKQQRLGELETKALEPDFWQDQNVAKQIMSDIEQLKNEIETANSLQSDIQAILELFNQSDEDQYESLREDIGNIEQKLLGFQTLKFMSGKYDKAGAILTLHAGQGGTEANDWTSMLLRMYTRFAEREGFKAEIIHMVSGTETGISSATLEIEGPYAFGRLKREAGTHRLVRISPFNAQNLRQTSFAGVEVIPLITDQDSDILIKDEDIEFKAVRAGGAGGQKVNKTSSAVQIKHLPTGITVHSTERRDQFQNRQAAMQILKAKLWQIEEAKREQELKSIKGEHKIAGWGNQIRNYVLHPYKLVKDLRTDVESSNPTEVLDGNLEPFIDAQIRIG